MILTGSPHDVEFFQALKLWFGECLVNLRYLTYDEFNNDIDFWQEVPGIVDALLRRVHDFQPDDGHGPWVSLEEFFVGYAQLTIHMVRLDTVYLTRFLNEPETPTSDLISRFYLPPLVWILQTFQIPFFRILLRLHGSEVTNVVARVNDHIAAPPIDILKHISEYTACLLALLPRAPTLSSVLMPVLTVAVCMVESGNDRVKCRADQELIDSDIYDHTVKKVYPLMRAVDAKYQAHISKKLPWVSGEVSDLILRYIAFTYIVASRRDQHIALQLAKDLSIDFPENATIDDYPGIIHYTYKFNILKKHIMDGRMELRVHGMEAMQNELIAVWKQFMQSGEIPSDHLVVQYLVKFLRSNKIVDYVLGVDSHPQLISRSTNIVGFLIVAHSYSDEDTDTIWRTVTESQDPRTVQEVLIMLSRTVHLHQSASNALLYLSSKLLDLPLYRFDSRMLEFCEQLFYHVREKYSERSRYEQPNSLHVDTVPLRVCVRLIRESAATGELSVEHKALLQKFASSQLAAFIHVGLSDTDRNEMYELCIQDIAEENQFIGGSMQALNALLPVQDSQEIRKLSTDFDLTSLVISEFARAIESTSTDFTDPFSSNGFISRIQILHRIIDKVPDTITPELSDILWNKIFMSKSLVQQGRSTLWDMLCRVTNNSMKQNPFIELCIETYLPKLSPCDYSPEILAFAKCTMNYEVRFNPPATAEENEVISIPGMDRIWNFVLAAPPGSIETDATNFAISVYLDHVIINRAPRSAARATHVSIVDRCVEQLKSAASKLKSSDDTSSDVRMDELRFSRSLLFLHQLLQGVRARPKYSPPPTSSPPRLPERPINGAPVDISYQSFDGGNHSGVNTLRIGDLSTASELVDRLVQVTGFSKFTTIYGGQRVAFLDNPDLLIRDMKVRSGLLIVCKVPDSMDFGLAKHKSQTLVDSEVLKHFDDLYDLLNLEDHLAREVSCSRDYIISSIYVFAIRIYSIAHLFVYRSTTFCLFSLRKSESKSLSKLKAT